MSPMFGPYGPGELAALNEQRRQRDIAALTALGVLGPLPPAPRTAEQQAADERAAGEARERAQARIRRSDEAAAALTKYPGTHGRVLRAKYASLLAKTEAKAMSAHGYDPLQNWGSHRRRTLADGLPPEAKSPESAAPGQDVDVETREIACWFAFEARQRRLQPDRTWGTGFRAKKVGSFESTFTFRSGSDATLRMDHWGSRPKAK